MNPPLRPLHDDSLLSPAKLLTYDKASTEDLVESLKPGNRGSLKTRDDGTIIDGHHRIKILRDRKVAVDDPPREIVRRDTTP